MKKKINLISLEKNTLENDKMKAIKGGGVCACRHQNTSRSNGYRRGAVIDGIQNY